MLGCCGDMVNEEILWDRLIDVGKYQKAESLDVEEVE